jgi:hypothetical protein
MSPETRRNSPAFFSVAMPDLECKAKKRKGLARNGEICTEKSASREQ